MAKSDITSFSLRDAVKTLYRIIESRGTDWEASPFLSKVVTWLIEEDQASGRKTDTSITIGACTFKLDHADPFTRSFLYGYEHEPVLLEVCKKLCGKTSTVWDIGANFGLYAIQLAAHAGPKARVTAFEPGLKALGLLKYNVKKNGLTDRIAVAGYAVGAENKKEKFHETANSAMSGLSDTGRSTESAAYDVAVRTMDEIWQEQGRPPLSLVKIDVEGHECDVLKGGRIALSHSPEAVIVFELSAKNLSKEQADNTKDILSEYATSGWRLLSCNSDGILIPLDTNLAGSPTATMNDIAIMVRADSQREKTIRILWEMTYKEHSAKLHTNLDPMPALLGISRYVTHLLGLRDGAHRQVLKQKDGEIASLSESLAASRGDVALLNEKVARLKAAVAEEAAKRADTAKGLTAATAEAQAAQGKLSELASKLSSRDEDGALLNETVARLKAAVAEAEKHYIEEKTKLAKHIALIEEINNYLTRSTVGRMATLASFRLQQLSMDARTLIEQNQDHLEAPSPAAPPPPAKAKGRHGTTLTDAFERLANHRLAIDHFISIGAGTGGDSIAIRDRFYPGASLLMIEAQAEHEPVLAEICRRGGDKTRYVICAATREDGVVHFQNSSPTGGVIASGKAEGTIAVPARSVDSLAKEYGLGGSCFLKFDTHGVEVDILAGATEVLKRTSLIMMETYNFKLNFVDRRNLTFDEMCGYLRERGFRCVDICDPLFRPNDHSLWQAHLFFIRADHPIFNSNSYNAPSPFAPRG